jgi:copper chaperone CopZ
MDSDGMGLNAGMTQTSTFEVDGVDADSMEASLDSIDGVRGVTVADNQVTVTYDPTVVDENAIRSAVENGGGTVLADGTPVGGAGGGLLGDVTDVSGNFTSRATK